MLIGWLSFVHCSTLEVSFLQYNISYFAAKLVKKIVAK